jgi:integrase/recombinase XerD
MSKRKQKRKQGKGVEERLRFLGAHVDGFRSWLQRSGYRPTTIVEVVRLLACWTEWLSKGGFALELNNILAGFDASALAFKGSKTARAPRGAAALFIRYLRERGLLASTPKPPSPSETWPILGAFRAWMRNQRGVADSTLDTYQTSMVDLLKALGDDPKAFTAQAVRAFVLERAKPHSRGRAKTIATSTRAFLRFLVATGQTGLCRPALCELAVGIGSQVPCCRRYRTNHSCLRWRKPAT